MLQLTPKDSVTVTDADINNAIAYAKQAGEDTSIDYSYDDDIVKAVIAAVADKRNAAAYGSELGQYQNANASGGVGDLANEAPFQEVRAVAQSDAEALPKISQTDMQSHNLSVNRPKSAAPKRCLPFPKGAKCMKDLFRLKFRNAKRKEPTCRNQYL